MACWAMHNDGASGICETTNPGHIVQCVDGRQAAPGCNKMCCSKHDAEDAARAALKQFKKEHGMPQSEPEPPNHHRDGLGT